MFINLNNIIYLCLYIKIIIENEKGGEILLITEIYMRLYMRSEGFENILLNKKFKEILVYIMNFYLLLNLVSNEKM